MDLPALMEMQFEFDKKHGWIPEKDVGISLLSFLQEDTIGLTGELGELAGIVKKIALDAKVSGTDIRIEIERHMPELKEELIDILIYLVRIMHYLDVDVEAEYLKKLERNKLRFQRYESK